MGIWCFSNNQLLFTNNLHIYPKSKLQFKWKWIMNHFVINGVLEYIVSLIEVIKKSFKLNLMVKRSSWPYNIGK